MKWLFSALAVTMAVAACGGSSSSPSGSGSAKTYALTIALPWPAKPPICCMEEPAASDLGYYKKEGLDVTFENVQTGSAGTIQTLVAGKADLVGASMAAGLAAYAAGATNIRYIGGELNNTPSLSKLKWFFAGKTSINQPSDLKGKKIGIGNGTNPTDPNYVQIHAVLTNAGMTDRDVDWVIAGTQAARDQALVAGRIDFTTIPMEDSYLLTPSSGLHLVFWDPAGGQTGWNGCECWFTTTDVLNDPDKKAAVQRFVNGTMLAIRDLIKSESTFKKAEGLYLDMTNQTQQSIDNTWNFERVQYQANGCMSLNLISDWFNNVYTVSINPSAKGKFKLRDVVDTSFVKAALDKLGTDQSATWDPPQLKLPS